MSISLYDTSVKSYLQILGATSAVLDKGKAHAAASGIDLAELLDTRLIENMGSLRFQVFCTAFHSIDAINGIKAGVFSPPASIPDLDYEGLQQLITDAEESLKNISAEEINALVGNDMRFEMGDFKIPFTAEGFILSFSLPNFYFHATTTYDILRMKGVPVGKMDFLGAMQVKA